MNLLTDSLLLAATLGAAVYCYVLAARLRRFATLEGGMGGAIAVLSAQVDDMTHALARAQGVAGGAERRLEALSTRAEAVSARLELLVAALHDLPEPGAKPEEVPLSPAPDAVRPRFIRRRSLRDMAEAAE